MPVKLTRRSVLLGATAMGAYGFASAPLSAQGERTFHALLIAATEYPNLPPKAKLIGPNNDATLVREFLLGNSPVRFEPENMIMLADNLEGSSGSPTLENILSALAAFASKVKHGDFVYVHYSGHGSQQPELLAGDETDGLDEILLPSDTGQWVDKTKGAPNALTDNVVGKALDAMRDRGAFVWIIFDCCNSGTATRAAVVDEAVTERKVDPADLGIPERELNAAVAVAVASRSTDVQPAERAAAFAVVDNPAGAQSIGRGDIVAFFAAQSIETTPEMPLPRGVPEATKFGLFTFTIFQKLAENPNVTYRQLGHAILQQYAADGRTRPTPLFEGMLDARVFGSEAVDTPMQWQVEIRGNRVRLPAGRMHRLSPGSKLALVPSPLSELAEAVGYVEVVTAENLTSTVRPIDYEGKPALAIDHIPARAFARVAQLEIDFQMLVARPGPSDGLDAQIELVNTTLADLVSSPDRKFNIKLVDPGADADLRLAVLRENAIPNAKKDATDSPAVWFLPPSGDVSFQGGAQPPLVAAVDPERLRAGAAGVLTKIFRATSLSRLAAGSDYRPDQVQIEFKLKREGKAEPEALQQAVVPRVRPGDEVHISATNLSRKLIDINILYVGSDYSITHIAAQRLVPDATFDEGLLAFTDTSFGFERMIAVLTEAPAQSEIEDLSFLAQDGVPPATRSAGSGRDYSSMLRDIGFAPSTRSAMKLGDNRAPMGAVMIFPLETVPLT